jgi:crenactin
MARPRDAKIGDVIFYGMLDMAETIVQAVERCPVELQPHLYSQILLSGGNFSWTPPERLKGVAVDSSTKLRHMLAMKGIENANIVVSQEPQYAVWRGCIVFGYAVPASYRWVWEKMEGWMTFR